MTNRPDETAPKETEVSGEILAKTAQQVAQQSRTLALHIRQHDGIEAAAQEKANVLIDKLRTDLESAYQSVLERTAQEIRSRQDRQFSEKLDQALAGFNNEVKELTGEFAAKLQDHLKEMEEAGRESQDRHARLMEQVESEIARNREEGQQQRQALEKSHDSRLSLATEALHNAREEQSRQYEQLCSDTVGKTAGLLDNALEENARATDSRLEEHRTRTNLEQREYTESSVAASEAKWKRTAWFLLALTLTATAIAAAALVMAAI